MLVEARICQNLAQHRVFWDIAGYRGVLARLGRESCEQYSDCLGSKFFKFPETNEDVPPESKCFHPIQKRNHLFWILYEAQFLRSINGYGRFLVPAPY